MVLITSFLSSVRGLEYLLFDEGFVPSCRP
jgi:hypothetical protein